MMSTISTTFRRIFLCSTNQGEPLICPAQKPDEVFPYWPHFHIHYSDFLWKNKTVDEKFSHPLFVPVTEPS
jgi:hypothetical protein